MIEAPLVSIIVVSYNHSKFIRENLDSIKRQTYSNIELIVADDASSDNSVKIYKNWLTENNWIAKTNYHTSNTGLVQTLNECLDMVSGKYVKLIAADDFLHDTYIENCVKYLKSHRLKAVFTQAFLIDSDSKILSGKYFPDVSYQNTAEMCDKLIENNFVPGSTLFVDVDVFKEVGKYERHTLLEDYNLALRLAEKKIMIGKIREELVYYRSHGHNIMKTKRDLIYVDAIREKIKFDKKGLYKSIIGRNIRDEIIAGNPLIKEMRLIYKNQVNKDFKTLVALYFPFVFRLIRKIK